MRPRYRAQIQRLYVIILGLCGIICVLGALGLVGYGYVTEIQEDRDELKQQRNNLETQVAATTNLSSSAPAADSPERDRAESTVTPTGFTAPAVGSATGQGELITGQIVGLRQPELYVRTSEIEIGGGSQQAFQTAQEVVERSQYDPQRYDGLVISLSAPGRWDRINGESIALGTALGYAATNRSISLNESVAATGDLTERGRVVSVTGIREKAQAAAEAGKDVLLVPAGQAITGTQLTVRGVGNFTEAAEYVFDDG